MSAELAVLTQQLDNAKSYIDVFGKDEDKLASNYRRMARVLHPDGKNAIDQQLASDAFVKLQSFYDTAKKAVANDTYGELPRVTITSRKFIHELIGNTWEGDISQVYQSITNGNSSAVGDDSVVKLVRSPRNNDLMENEASSLRKIYRCNDIAEFQPYFPMLFDSFKHNQSRANVLSYLDGFYTLKQVREAYGEKLNPLDAAWMWRRMLVALGAAHEAGVVHGAVLPEHVMIQPEQHGLVLIDWCYSGEPGDKPKAMSKKYKDLYPPDFKDEELLPGTDVYMAAATMTYLNGDNMPRPLRAFMRGCMLDRVRTRPQKAFDLLQEYDELLERMGEPYHPRRFREFRMPR